jgi:hypothetical protein
MNTALIWVCLLWMPQGSGDTKRKVLALVEVSHLHLRQLAYRPNSGFLEVKFDRIKRLRKEGTPMDQVVEQVVEIKEEVVELSLAELAQVGGGLNASFF